VRLGLPRRRLELGCGSDITDRDSSQELQIGVNRQSRQTDQVFRWGDSRPELPGNKHEQDPNRLEQAETVIELS
jgi:hypothetical protein